MVRFISGRAGSGKTYRVISEISDAASHGLQELVLLVPEQYSHTTERLLCSQAGDSIARYAEVLSFRRLATRVFTVAGGLAREILDNGARILMMHQALKQAKSSLRVLGSVSERPEFLSSLLEMTEELKTCRVKPENLLELTPGALGDKLHDIAVISSAYDGLFSYNQLDPADELTYVAEAIKKSGFFHHKHVWIDGYSGFTPQEYEIVRLIFAQAEETSITLCLNDDPDGENGAFHKAWQTFSKLEHMAGQSEMIRLTPGVRFIAPELAHLEKNIFHPSPETMDECSAIELYRVDGVYEECELAATRILSMVRENDMRYRDIWVCARNFDDYASTLEAVFERYGVPVYLSHKSAILDKAPMAFVLSALACIGEGFRYNDMIKYLKTGLCGVRRKSLDQLENYLYTWNVQGKLWTRDEGFIQNVSGRNTKPDEEEERKLAFINRLRARVRTPLMHLKESLRIDHSGIGYATALFAFFTEVKMKRHLEARAILLRRHGNLQRADEYEQLWNLLIAAIESIARTLPDEHFTVEAFSGLFSLLLSQYEVGTIPASLDRVQAGGLERLGQGTPRCMIVLGACDGSMPMSAESHGLLNDIERERLSQLGIELTSTAKRRLLDEFRLIYTGFSTASERLIVVAPRAGMDGGEKRESFVVKKLFSLFPQLRYTEPDVFAAYAVAPCFDMAVSRGDSPWRSVARDYFKNDVNYASRMALATRNAQIPRGPIKDPENIQAIFGHTIRLSASRTDSFVSCRYQYFLKYGLKLKPRRLASLDAPEIGSFIHYVLEKTLREVKTRGGHRKVTEETVHELCDISIEQFVNERLGGFLDRTPRFIYLFKRLRRTVHAVVMNIHEELKPSRYEPLDFELHFSDHDGDLPALHLSGDNYKLKLEGFVDRVDGCVMEDTLYLRVVDYKSGKKDFNLKEVINGLNMQLLLYLFTLCGSGRTRYGKQIEPGGVLYIPARAPILSASGTEDDEWLNKAHDSALVRHGLLLDNSELIGASERFLPVKISENGTFDKKSSVISSDGFQKIAKQLNELLHAIGTELSSGVIDANPYFKNANETACDWCEMRSVCHFDERCGDKRRYLFVNKMEGC